MTPLHHHNHGPYTNSESLTRRAAGAVDFARIEHFDVNRNVYRSWDGKAYIECPNCSAPDNRGACGNCDGTRVIWVREELFTRGDYIALSCILFAEQYIEENIERINAERVRATEAGDDVPELAWPWMHIQVLSDRKNRDHGGSSVQNYTQCRKWGLVISALDDPEGFRADAALQPGEPAQVAGFWRIVPPGERALRGEMIDRSRLFATVDNEGRLIGRPNNGYTRHVIGTKDLPGGPGNRALHLPSDPQTYVTESNMAGKIEWQRLRIEAKYGEKR